MARSQSPGYPNFPLPKAIEYVRKIFSSDRRNPIDREVAAKHCGYNGLSGASDKVLGSLGHYGLLERAGKGQVRVSATAVDILHPDPTRPDQRKRALQQAAFSPTIFESIRSNFSDGLPSEVALKSWLMREEFLDRAINPVTKAYLETCLYLEQEKAIESGGLLSQEDVNQLNDEHGDALYGGAQIGDLVQWEIDGVLQMEQPMRVRAVSEDGLWIAVDGSETGIPMEQVTVQERAIAPAKVPPKFAIETPREEISDTPKGHRSEKFDADEGVVTISWPANLSTQSVEDMQEWVELLMKRIERRAKAGEGMDRTL